MKNKLYKAGFLLMVMLLSSCDNEIDLFHEDQEKTYVVFGLLNSTDEIQQVKIRMTSVTDAAIAEISIDSTGFSASPLIQVSLQEWQNNNYATYPMSRIHYSNEPGIFMNTRNDLYETHLMLFLDMAYKLIITNPENGDLVESKIVPVPAPKLAAPNWSWIRYNFSLESDPFNIRFREVPRTYVYLIGFTINYLEIYNSGDTLRQKGTWVFRPVYADVPPDYFVTRENFGKEHNQHIAKPLAYRAFEQLIPDRPDLSYRQLISFDISVWGGDQNLRNYMEYGLKFNDNRKQAFTNISNGIGFFGACSHSDCLGILPDQNFMDSLPLDPLTAHLKFRTELYRIFQHSVIQTHDDFLSLIPQIRHE